MDYKELFSILFHHQTTTHYEEGEGLHGCLVSYFITKPQLKIRYDLQIEDV